MRRGHPSPRGGRAPAHAAPAARLAWGVAALILASFAVFEGAKHGPGAATILLASAIAPDLTLIGAFAEPGRLRARRVAAYNAAHRLWAPLILLAAGILVPWPLPMPLDGVSAGLAAFLAGLGWLGHVAADRALGFGLRAPDGSTRAPAVRVLERGRGEEQRAGVDTLAE